MHKKRVEQRLAAIEARRRPASPILEVDADLPEAERQAIIEGYTRRYGPPAGIIEVPQRGYEPRYP